jgi:hypothetical protein
MTSCPSLLDTLGFLKFPDSTIINFSEDGTSDILKSLKSDSEPVIVDPKATSDEIKSIKSDTFSESSTKSQTGSGSSSFYKTKSKSKSSSY